VIDFSAAAVLRRTERWCDTSDEDARRELDARMMWSALAEPGDGVAGALVSACGARAALEIALGSAPGDLGTEVAAGALAAAKRRWTPRLADASFASEAAQRADARPLIPTDHAWPYRLDDLGVHAPLCVWVRGDVGALSRPAAVALVGARAATAYGEQITSALAADLASDGIAVVSGAAYGIDGAAHRAALAVGGSTAAWLAGGVDRPYPSGHRDLLGRILANGGAVASDVPCGSAPTKWRFLARNRLIAAAADATVVVEAGWRSGSLNTAAHAAELGRPVGAVPGPVTSAASAGCHRLLREYGAQCVTGSDDVRELLGRTTAPPLFDTGRTDELTRVRDALSSRSERTVAELARRAGMDPDAVVSALGLLALEGGAVRGTSGAWRASPR
jgi:DNA processing protein